MVRTAAGEGVLIAGDRGSGKSTTALRVSERLGAQVICDETALIHCRTTLVEPFPHSVGVWRNGRKVQTPITEVCTRIAREAVPVHRMLFLKPGAPTSRVSRRSRSDALRELLPHHRAAGASIGDAMQTLLHLAARTDSWSIEYTEHHELVDLVCGLIDA
jgi:DNA polymerase III delta prime subunit